MGYHQLIQLLFYIIIHVPHHYSMITLVLTQEDTLLGKEENFGHWFSLNSNSKLVRHVPSSCLLVLSTIMVKILQALYLKTFMKLSNWTVSEY